MLRVFRGVTVWVEEHGESLFIIHLDQELKASEALDGEKWILVDTASPLFEALRLHSRRYNTLRWTLIREIRDLFLEVVDMAVFCQAGQITPASSFVSSFSQPALSVLFVLQVRLVGGTAF